MLRAPGWEGWGLALTAVSWRETPVRATRHPVRRWVVVHASCVLSQGCHRGGPVNVRCCLLHGSDF